MNIKECKFEEDIEAYMLSAGGYTKGDLKTYDRAKALDMPKLISYIEKAQPNEWKRYNAIYGSDSENKLYKRIDESVKMHGLLYVLRHGIKDRGVTLKFASFKAETSLNPKVIEDYEANILTCTRQFRYSTENENSIDMVLSLNGFPIVAIELKNQLTGQSVENAKKQYMYDRNPKELCFQFDSRFLVYFAVDLYEVAMTTCLKGKDTFFLPFNQGSNGAGNVGGAGNPTNEDGYTTSYLWEKVLQKDVLMDIIQRYMHRAEVEKVNKKTGKKTISQKLIFPRYHQLDVVTKLLADVKANGSGKNYLIQHSAGSGKSNSIAWLAYGLANLHNAKDEKIFKSVIVVTDRTVLDGQLQKNIYSFDHTEGVVEKIDEDKHSSDLRDAINAGKKIIITTLQKFPYIYKEIDDNTDKNFAVIVDEAHSSQSGSSAMKLKSALADTEEVLKEYEPLLHTMFVDKKLKGVKAVQTLSRLNRTCAGKTDTFVLDFVNTADEIKEAFEPYYEATILDEEINPNLIYDTRKLIRDFGLYNDEDIEKFLKIFLKKGNQTNADLGKMTSLLKPIVDRYKALEEDKRFDYKKTIRNFVKWYSYITQISRMFDKQLHEEFTFCQYLEKLLPPASNAKDVDLEDKLKLEFYKLEQQFKGSISLAPTEETQTLVNPKTLKTSGRGKDEDELLDTIIVRINDKYNGIFTDADRVIVETIYHNVLKTESRLKAYAKKNDEAVFRQSIFPEIFQKVAQECYMESMGAFSKLFEDKAFYDTVMEAISREAYKDLRNRK